jgi:hypothetical protein
MFQRSASSSAQSAIRPTHTKKLFDCLRLGGYLFLQVSNRSWRPLFKSFDQWNNLRTSNLELTESGSSGMKASRQFRIFLIASSISLFAHRSFGQPTPASSEAGNPSRAARQDSGSTGSQITLDVVVTDKSGRPQGGLQPQDFTLLDNKSPQKILSFQAKKPGRKMVIWLSPGWPQLASSGAQLYSKGKEQIFSTLVLVSTAIQQARITLYSIDPEGAGGSGVRSRFSYESYLKGIASAKDVMPPNLSLQVLATRSGGRVLTTGNDIASQIDDCISDTKAFYVLSFASTPTERPDEYHTLELKVDKPGLTAHTTAGYYAQPEQRPQAPDGKKK